MNRQQIDALNAAGEALKGLGMGTVRLRYRAGDDLIPSDRFSFWIEDDGAEAIGVGFSPADALENAKAERDAKRPTYILCPVCQGSQRGATPCAVCNGTFHVLEAA